MYVMHGSIKIVFKVCEQEYMNIAPPSQLSSLLRHWVQFLLLPSKPRDFQRPSQSRKIHLKWLGQVSYKYK